MKMTWTAEMQYVAVFNPTNVSRASALVLQSSTNWAINTHVVDLIMNKTHFVIEW